MLELLRRLRGGGDIIIDLHRIERPVEGEVGDLLPARLADDVVRAAGELLVRGDRLRFPLEPGFGARDRGGRHVVRAAGDQEQRGAVVIVKIDTERRVRIEIRQSGLEEEAAGTRNGVTAVDGVRFLLGEGVGEGVVKFLRRQHHGAMIIGRIFQRREGGAEGGEGKVEHPLDRRRIDRHPSRAQTAIEQDLHGGSTHGVPHDDRRSIEPADDLLIMIHHIAEAEVVHMRMILAKRVDIPLHAGPASGDHLEAAALETLDPVLPRQCREP